MSLFKVEVCQIESILPHHNADRLALAQLTNNAYQFIIAKDSYQVGDQVVYFPLDSLLPDKLIEQLGLTDKLANSTVDGLKHRNRIRTVRLRGVISQGLVARLNELDLDPAVWPVGSNLTDQLSVSKYEPPVPLDKSGQLIGLPPLVSVYDLENAENFSTLITRELLNQPVAVTEKLEGSHWGLALSSTDTLSLLQRRYAIQDYENHTWWRATLQADLPAKIITLRNLLNQTRSKPINLLTLRGEIVGPAIQGNLYRLTQHAIYVFEIEIDGQPIDAIDFQCQVANLHLTSVPLLSHGSQTLHEWLAGRSLRDASNGHSALADVLREGIVIKPLMERNALPLGRIVLKQRSPDYLANEK